jgi:hypothetical protein
MTCSQQKQYNKTTSLLIAAQTWRIVGIAFIWGMTQRFFDPTMAIPSGVGDILVGVTAIPFAIFFGRVIDGQSTLLWFGMYWG